MPQRQTSEFRVPIKLASRDFTIRKYEYYGWLREHAPVSTGRIAFLKVALLSKHEDCRNLLLDDRFVRNRATATGGRRWPFPMPPALARLSRSMIVEDDPAHQRQRSLVNKAFTSRSVERLSGRVEQLTNELIDGLPRNEEIDLLRTFATPIPVAVISELIGVPSSDMAKFKQSIRALTQGLSGYSIARTLFFDLPSAMHHVTSMIARKRESPNDDLLSELIQVEDAGDRLSEDELVSLVFLLVVAGFETTVHLISNAVATLLDHPEQLEKLRANPELFDSAVDEIIRYRGPIHGTKMNYATEDVTIRGVVIRKGTPVIPLLGAANHDVDAFDHPQEFDVTRHPNPHLGLGFGRHYCLGAQLARMETRIALRQLFARYPNVRLTRPSGALEYQNWPLWHRLQHLPVRLDP